MNLKRFGLILLLVSVVSVGVLFSQTAQSIAGTYYGTGFTSDGTAVTFTLVLYPINTFDLSYLTFGVGQTKTGGGSYLLSNNRITLRYNDGGNNSIGFIEGNKITIDGVVFTKR